MPEGLNSWCRNYVDGQSVPDSGSGNRKSSAAFAFADVVRLVHLLSRKWHTLCRVGH